VYHTLNEFKRRCFPESYREELARERDEEFGPLGYGFIAWLRREIKEGLLTGGDDTLDGGRRQQVDR